MRNKYYFISDIHLGLLVKEKEKEREETLVKFLNSIQKDAKALFIVGDLYDFWFEYRRVYQKGYFKTLTALANLVDSGVEVNYFIGNHDFMHRDFFTEEIGLKLIPDGMDITLENKRFFIAHGDGMVKNDLGYNILKKILRNRFLQFIYSLIHPDLGIWLASGTSKKSREYTSKKDYGEEDGLFDAAKNFISNGYDFVVFGHLHTKIYKPYNNGFYINLGTWLKKPGYGLFVDGKFELLDI